MTPVPNILIVDDDLLNIKLLRKALADMGTLYSVADGTAALALLAEHPIDLILLDIVMPGLDGFMTCRALRQDHPEIVVVFMTAVTAYENEVEAFAAGGNDFISKPFNLPVVRARVAMHLKFKAQQVTRRQIEQEVRDLNADLERMVEERTAQLRVAYDALRRSEEQFRALVETSSDCIWELDARGYFTYLSPRFRDITGYPAAKFIGRSPLDLLPGDAPPAVRAALLAGLTAHRALMWFEQPVRHRHGRRVYVEVSGIPVIGPQGEYQGMRGVTRDITARLRQEKALLAAREAAARQASEQRLGALVEQGLAGIAEIDLEGRLLRANDRYCEIIGHPRAALLGKRLSDFTGSEDWTRKLVVLQRLAAGGPPEIIDKCYRRQDGGVVHVQVATGVVRDATGMPAGYLCLVNDVTALRESEARLRETEQRWKRALDGAGHGVWDWHITTGLVDFSTAWKTMLGYAEEEIGGDVSEWSTRVHPDDLAAAQAAVQAHLSGATPSYECIHRLRCKDGRWKWILDRGMIFERDATGRPLRMLGTHTDISVQKTAEQHLLESEGRYRDLNAALERRVAERTAELQAANAVLLEREEILRAAKQAAEAANEAKGAFLAHMSHEIRTPMNAVLGLTQVLEKTPLSPDQHHMVAQIATAGRSLLGILNDILDLSKIEAGQLPIDEQPFTLPPLLDHIESLLGRVAHDKGLALSVAEAPAMAGVLIGDPLRLEQVLVNLIGNAIKFTDQGEVRVRIESGECTDRGLRLRFAVSDTGIGIAPATMAGLFTPFTQADGSITRRFGGTGLGLSICKRLVDLMGGTIGAESQPGVGSTFWFEVPFARTAATSPPPAPTPEQTAPRGRRLAGLHLLVADDSLMNREVVEWMLTLEGARATMAEDGRQALDRLRARPRAFDAVLMDIQMPVMDGLTATRVIRTDLGLTDLPIIALTAGVLPEQQAAAWLAGVDGVLAKPLDLEQLATELSQWVRSPRSSAAPSVPAAEGRGEYAVGRPDAGPTAGLSAPPDEAPDPAAEFPLIPGIDRDQAARGADHAPAFFRRLLQRFAADFSGVVERTRNDLAAGERAAAARRVHALRGSAAYLGALELMTTAGALEEAIAAGAPELDARLATLERQLNGILDASAAWRSADDQSATEPAPARSPAPPLDPDQLQALCTALRSQNFRARRLYHALEPALHGVLDGERRRALAQCMRELRFAEALAILERDAVGAPRDGR